ncbi:cysteine--tRNA ligase [Chloroflexota bacterium]
MKVFNTLSGRKEEFLPQGSEVKIYVCGVTPYDECHIGHAMSYIIFDIIRRYLRFRDYRVKYVQNVTDIDDKIIDRANQRGIPANELAQQYTDSFFEDMDALNIERADFYPRATEEIAKIIEVIGGLINKGHAYPSNGSVYFRVKNFPDYGKLSRRSLESMMSSCSIEMGREKEHPMDFALWKAAKPGEPYWESPWGQGRPGWHIECSAMSLKYLGDSLDIHGGGQDLIFPHHENEIAQSECFTETKPFAKYWLHNGMVQFGEEKMSKSLGNLITIKEALEKYGADALRVFVLSSHYRSPLTYSEKALEAAKVGAERLARVISRDDPTEGKEETLDAEPYRKQFIEAMDDDFNTPQAIATLFDLAREINQAGDGGIGIDKAQNTLVSLARDVLGLKLPEIITRTISDTISINEEIIVIKETVDTTVIPGTVNARVNRLVKERLNCRTDKNWQRADEIRNKLAELGVILEDTKAGTGVTYKHAPSEESLERLLAELGITLEAKG